MKVLKLFFCVFIGSVILNHKVLAQDLVGLEYFIDSDLGVGQGVYVPISSSELLDTSISVSLSELSEGPHIMGFRVVNNFGKWSLYETRFFYIFPLNGAVSSAIASGEWFLDTDPGVGNATPFSMLNVFGSVNQNVTISLNNLSEGPHRLCIRLKNQNGIWSHYESRLFYVFSIQNDVPESPIARGEWFVDVDPGVGNGILFDIPNGVNADVTLDLTMTNLEVGDHLLYIRVQDTSGKWTHYEGRLINVGECIPVQEACNGIDDDCDGIPDNGLTFVDYYNDLDADSFGSGTATSACQSPGSNFVMNNTDCNDNNAIIQPSATEICGNDVDEDCSGADLNCPFIPSMNAVNILSIGNYGTGSQTFVSVNFATGVDNIESSGQGIDRWYQFTAQSNAIRIQLSGNASLNDDNEISLYDYTTSIGQALIPLVTENDVSPSSMGISTDGGNEILYYDQLQVGNVYWICLQNLNNTQGLTSLRVAYLGGSAMDIGVYTNNTNAFNSTCQNFKCKFKQGSSYYTFNLWDGNVAENEPNWIYSTSPTTTGVASTILPLGRLVGANIGSMPVQYTVKVDAHYALKDAFGNTEQVVGLGLTPGVFTMNTEADLNLRTTDRCPVYKNPTAGSMATNRSVCGTFRYLWQMLMTAPSQGLPQMLNGPTGGSRILPMSSIPSIASNQQFNINIASQHINQQTQSNFGSIQCMRTTAFAGLPVIYNEDPTTQTLGSRVMIYPNPNQGEGVTISLEGIEGEINMVLIDATGRLLEKTTWHAEEYLYREWNFNQTLSSGLYEIRIQQGSRQETQRMLVVR